MHGHKISHQQGLHFITLTVVGWVDVFTRQLYRDIIMDSLRYCQKGIGLVVNAYVVMSNHVHLVVYSRGEKLSNIIRDFKKFTSTQIIKSVLQNPRESRSTWMLNLFKYYAKYNMNNKKYQPWQHNNKPTELYNPKWINRRLNYVHLNPVKAGIVIKPEDYVYSSAKDYFGEEGLLKVEVIDVSNDAHYF